MSSDGIRRLHTDVYVGVIMLLIGGVMMWMAFEFPIISRRFPLMGTGLFALCALIILVRGITATRTQQDNAYSPFAWHATKYPLMTFLILVGYVLAIRYATFMIATSLVVSMLMLFFGVRSWKSIVLMVVGLDVFVWLLFVKQLNMVLP